MVKSKSTYVCQQCGTSSLRWEGRCSSCNVWNSFVEEVAIPKAAKQTGHLLKEDPILLKDVQSQSQNRYQTKILELDRVLGGGVVPGSVTLIGGDPGIGKSTLSLQVGCSLSERNFKVLYGEW